MSKLGVRWGPERVHLAEETADTKAGRRERGLLIPETEISPVMIGKNVGVFPPEPVGQQAALLPTCLLPHLIPGPLGQLPAQS